MIDKQPINLDDHSLRAFFQELQKSFTVDNFEVAHSGFNNVDTAIGRYHRLGSLVFVHYVLTGTAISGNTSSRIALPVITYTRESDGAFLFPSCLFTFADGGGIQISNGRQVPGTINIQPGSGFGGVSTLVIQGFYWTKDQ